YNTTFKELAAHFAINTARLRGANVTSFFKPTTIKNNLF
ncbi:MAG: hypothetical protein ACJAUQ_001160, partial [Maribacter sp.]